MIVEKELAGFVLPYAAGTFITAGLGLISLTYFSSSVTMLAIGTVAVSGIWYLSQRRVNFYFSWALIVSLGFACGIFCGLNSFSIGAGEIENLAAGFGGQLASAIDGLPFKKPETNAIIKALIAGEKVGILSSVVKAFRESGAAHILALSGFHLGIIYAIVKYSLFWLGNTPGSIRLRSLLIMLLCGFYTLSTGAGPSIVRALLFIILGELATLTHRHRSTVTIFYSSMLIQLILSPTSIKSVSFQLSYAAIFGIAYIHPYLKSFWPGNPLKDSPIIKLLRSIWNSASLSISCQLTTGPLAWIYFHSFPSHFLLTNLIAIPLTSLIIPFSLLTLLLSLLGLCPDILLSLTELLITTLTHSLETISTM